MNLYNSIKTSLLKIVKDAQLQKYFSTLDSAKISLLPTDPKNDYIGINFKSDIITFYTINGEIPLYGGKVLSSTKEDPNNIDKIIDITNKESFKSTDKITITFFSADKVTNVLETYDISKENFIKIWNIIFEDLFINYRADLYYQ